MIYALKLTVIVTIESELNADDALEQFQSETDYDFYSTDNCKVTNLELRDGEVIGKNQY